VLDAFSNSFLVDFDLRFSTFLKQLGSLFVTFWDHFGMLWLLVATLQAHWVPESQKIANFVKKCVQHGSPFGSLLNAIDSLRLKKGLPWSQNGAQSGSKLRFVGFVEMSVFPR